MRNGECKDSKAAAVRQAFRQFPAGSPVPAARLRRGRRRLTYAAVAVLVLAALWVWLDVRIARARSQRLAVQTVAMLGGKAYYEHQVDEKFHIYCLNPHAPSPDPAWVKQLLGEDLFSRVAVVDLRGRTNVRDADLAMLRHFPALKFVDLADVPNISSDGLAHLRSLDQLERVVLTSPKVTRAALAHLRDLSRLEVLCLLNARLDDDDLMPLLDLPCLELLVVSAEKISQKAADAFMHKRPRCEVLRLEAFPTNRPYLRTLDANEEARIEADHLKRAALGRMGDRSRVRRNRALLGVFPPALTESVRARGVL